MASEAELADLFLTLRAVNAPLLRSFEESTTAGESMVAALDAMFGEIDAMLARTAESAAALRAELAGVAESAGAASAGTAGGGAAVAGAAEGTAAGAATTGAGAAAEAEAAAVSTATSEEVAAWDRVLAEMAQVRAETAMTAQANATEWSAMATKISAENEGLIASTKAYGDTMVATGTKVDEAAAAQSRVGAKLSAVTGVLKGPAIAAGIVGIAVVKMAADYETSTNRLLTSGGEIQANIGMVRKGMLDMAGEVGVSAEQLAKHIYVIESAGYHGAEGLGVLKAAEQGAKAEGANATTVADALSSAMRDYYPNAKGAGEVTKAATDVMSKFIGATSAGKMTFQDLASSLHSVLPAASVAKVSLSDILGALAAMTVHGMSADQATQNLAHTIGHLQTVTAPQAKELALLGMTAQQVSGDLGSKGLTGTVQEIANAIQKNMGPGATSVVLNLETALSKLSPQVQALGRQALDGTMGWKDYTKAAGALPPELQGQAASFATLAKTTHGIGQEQKSAATVMQTYSQALKAALGDQTGMNVALMLTGQNADYTNSAVQQVSTSTADAQGNVKGWADIQGTANQKMSEAKAGLESLGITIGQKLLPVVTKVASVVASASQWLSKHGLVATILAGIIGGILVTAIIAYTAKIMWSIGQTAVSFVADIAKGAWWVATKLGQFVAVSASALTEAAATAGRWLYAQGVILAGEAKDGIAWVAAAVGHYVSVAASAVIQAAKSSAAWLASNAKLVGQGLASLATWAAETASKYAAASLAAVVAAGKATAAWLANAATMGGQVLTGIKSAAVAIADLAKAMGVAMVNGAKAMAAMLVETVIPALGSAATAAWGFTIALLANPVTWIVLGIIALGVAIYLLVTHWKQVSAFLSNAWHSFTKWAKGIWDDIAGFFKDVWNKISGFFKDGWNHIWNWIKDQWEKGVRKDVAIWEDIGKFFSNLWKNIKQKFEDGWHNLWNWVKDQWDQGVHKDVMVWLDISKFFSNLWDNIKKWVQEKVHEIVSNLKQEWNDFLNFWKGVGDGIKTKAEDAWNAVLNFFKGIPDKVKGFFSDAGRWLADAGKAILNGLLGGLKDAWNAVTGFIGGIGNWISSHKGPIEVDRQLLTPHGNAIMQGLLAGLQAGGKHVTGYLDNFTQSIGATGVGSLGVGLTVAGGSAAPPLAASSGPSGGGIVVNVCVHGSVTTENQLVRAVQKGILQLSSRNSGFGLAPAFQ